MNIKNQLLSASANCRHMHFPDTFISFIDQYVKRATPDMFRLFKLSILLYKTFNEAILETERIDIIFELASKYKQHDFKIVKKPNKLLIGLNILCNIFYELNRKIPLE
jgi:hypothetical protein